MCIPGSPLWSWPCLMLLLLSTRPAVAAVAHDPCAFAANPELCHYEQAKSLLAQLSQSQDVNWVQSQLSQLAQQSPVSAGASVVVSDKSLVEVNSDVRSVASSATQEIVSGPVTTAGSNGFTDVNVDPPAAGSLLARKSTTADLRADPSGPVTIAASADHNADTPADESLSQDEDLQLKTMVLKQALDVLESGAPASPSLANVTMHLEEELEDIAPGAVDTFRSEHLAATINGEKSPPSLHLRAAVAARMLSAAEWGNKGEMPAAVATLEQMALQGRHGIDEKYTCSLKSCSTFGCGTGADPANSECDPTAEKRCADGHGKCRRERGKLLKGTFKIEVMAEPGSFVYMPDWDESKISAISAVEHTKEPGPAGEWHVVLNSDHTLMMYTNKWGPDFWLSMEEDKGKKVLAYRAFTSPVASAFTVHTNKEEDQIYLRDVSFNHYIMDGGEGAFKPDLVLDKKAANLKFHPPLPKEVDMIADSAHCMSLVSLILVCVLINF